MLEEENGIITEKIVHENDNQPQCANRVGFEDKKCQGCVNFNYFQHKDLTCHNHWEYKNETFLKNCENTMTNSVCSLCRRTFWPFTYFFDPMRRGFCRNQNKKCPVGKGFYIPDPSITISSTTLSSKQECVTCPINCMRCHVTVNGVDYLCFEKWPANLEPFSPTRNSFTPPRCKDPNCEVCEQTPCDKCKDGYSVKVEPVLQTGPNVWKMKMYSCIESASDTCPDSLSFVKQNRPDRPNFCIASNYTTLVGFKKYSTNPRKFQICSDDCKLCNAYSSSHSLCNICDTSNKKYNFPQAGPFQ